MQAVESQQTFRKKHVDSNFSVEKQTVQETSAKKVTSLAYFFDAKGGIALGCHGVQTPVERTAVSRWPLKR
jgi:hypothetical protein